MLAIHQSRVPWDEPIVLPLGEGLYVARAAAGRYVVRCACGHVFGDHGENWKLAALVHVRSTEAAIGEIYSGLSGCDPDWMELREFFCPGCRRQLEVEAVPPGYPITFDFQPDLETLYEDWLGRPLP
jgi:acetone carboxylase gamma subunit